MLCVPLCAIAAGAVQLLAALLAVWLYENVWLPAGVWWVFPFLTLLLKMCNGGTLTSAHHHARLSQNLIFIPETVSLSIHLTA